MLMYWNSQDILLIYVFVMWVLNLKWGGLEFCFSIKGLC